MNVSGLGIILKCHSVSRASPFFHLLSLLLSLDQCFDFLLNYCYHAFEQIWIPSNQPFHVRIADSYSLSTKAARHVDTLKMSELSRACPKWRWTTLPFTLSCPEDSHWYRALGCLLFSSTTFWKRKYFIMSWTISRPCKEFTSKKSHLFWSTSWSTYLRKGFLYLLGLETRYSYHNHYVGYIRYIGYTASVFSSYNQITLHSSLRLFSSIKTPNL